MTVFGSFQVAVHINLSLQFPFARAKRMTDTSSWGWAWWALMVSMSIFNVVLLVHTLRRKHAISGGGRRADAFLRAGAIVFTVVAAYRSIWPRVDVPRRCWFDTPLNWVFFGRLAATAAELVWAAQIALVQRRLAAGVGKAHAAVAGRIAPALIVALAAIAECCSWTCLCTENRLFCVCEESLWTLLFAVACACVAALDAEGRRAVWAPDRPGGPSLWRVGYRGLAVFLFLCVLAQVAQVVLYATRYAQDGLDDYHPFGVGFTMLFACAETTRSMAVWWPDALWMTGYFSCCVWSSIWLAMAPAVGGGGGQRPQEQRLLTDAADGETGGP